MQVLSGAKFPISTARMQSAIVGLQVQDDGAKKCFGIFSGFVIEFRDAWLWVTAGHVLDEIELWRKSSHELIYAFVAASDDVSPSRSFLVPFERFKTLNFLDNARVAARRSPRSKWHRRMSEQFDLAFVEIEPLYCAYLIERGVVPFRRLEYDVEETELEKAMQEGWTIVVAGFPCAGAEVTPSGRSIIAPFKVLPLCPGSVKFPRLILKPGWDQADFPHSVKGVSGGPVCILTKSTPFLVGVQSAQSPSNGYPNELYMVETPRLMEVLEENVP